MTNATVVKLSRSKREGKYITRFKGKHFRSEYKYSRRFMAILDSRNVSNYHRW